MFTKEDYIKNINHVLSVLQTEIKGKGYLGLYDSHTIAEDFMVGLLNKVYGYKLKNMNYLHPNYPGIDLGDTTNKIAFQVTSENKSKKIQDTIDQFIKKKLYKRYSQLNFFILHESYKPRTNFNTSDNFVFDKAKHILDFERLIKKIRKLSTEELQELSNFIGKEVKTSVQIGASIDAEVELKAKYINNDSIKESGELYELEVLLKNTDKHTIENFKFELEFPNLNDSSYGPTGKVDFLDKGGENILIVNEDRFYMITYRSTGPLFVNDRIPLGKEIGLRYWCTPNFRPSLDWYVIWRLYADNGFFKKGNINLFGLWQSSQ